MVPLVLGGLDQFVHRHLRGRYVRIAERQVDDVLTRPARLSLEFVDMGEDVRWQAVDASEIDRRSFASKSRVMGRR